MFEVSQSRIKAWRRCRRMYHYDFVEKIQSRRPKIQLIRGTIIGQCLDAVAAKKSIDPVIAPYAKKYRELFLAEREIYGDLLGDVRSIVKRYQAVYKNDGLSYRKYGSEVELKFELVSGIVFSAHMDKYPQDAEGRWWVMDHKTHKKIPDENDRFQDIQLVLYHWGAPKGGLPKPIGVVWDYIRTKMPAIPEVLNRGGLSQRQNIDTDYETYMEAIRSNKLDPKDYREILTRLKSEGNSNFFQRVWLPKPNAALVDNLVGDMIATAKEMKATHGEKNPARNMNNLCKSCKFFTLCQAELRGLDSEFIRKSEYEPKPEEKTDAEEEE